MITSDSFRQDFLVLKILSINKQDFQIGFKVGVHSYENDFRIGCFDQGMNQIGYGIHVLNPKDYAPGTEEPIRSNSWLIEEGNLRKNGEHLIFNTLKSTNRSVSSKHEFEQVADYTQHRFFN